MIYYVHKNGNIYKPLCYISYFVQKSFKIEEDTKMAYKINSGCVSCGACADACPVGAIAEGATQYEINADACLECGACAATCPTGSIEE